MLCPIEWDTRCLSNQFGCAVTCLSVDLRTNCRNLRIVYFHNASKLNAHFWCAELALKFSTKLWWRHSCQMSFVSKLFWRTPIILDYRTKPIAYSESTQNFDSVCTLNICHRIVLSDDKKSDIKSGGLQRISPRLKFLGKIRIFWA